MVVPVKAAVVDVAAAAAITVFGIGFGRNVLQEAQIAAYRLAPPVEIETILVVRCSTSQTSTELFQTVSPLRCCCWSWRCCECGCCGCGCWFILIIIFFLKKTTSSSSSLWRRLLSFLQGTNRFRFVVHQQRCRLGRRSVLSQQSGHG